MSDNDKKTANPLSDCVASELSPDEAVVKLAWSSERGWQERCNRSHVGMEHNRLAKPGNIRVESWISFSVASASTVGNDREGKVPKERISREPHVPVSLPVPGQSGYPASPPC